MTVPQGPWPTRTTPDDVRLAEALDVTASRFRGVGLLLAVLDERGDVLLHDERVEPEFLRQALAAIASRRHQAASAGRPALTADATEAACVVRVEPIAPRRQLAIVGRAAGDASGDAPAVPRANAASLAAAIDALVPAIRGTLLDQLGFRVQASQLDGLTGQLADHYEELSLLYQVSGGIRVNRDPEDYFRGLCNDLSAVLGTRAMGACLRTGRGLPNRLVVTGDLPLDPPLLSRFIDETFERLVDSCAHPAAAGAAPGSVSETALAGGSLLLSDLRADPSLEWLVGRVRQVLAAPMVRGGQMFGFLFAVDRESGEFDSVDGKLLGSVAGVSAIYVENALLYDDAHGLLMGLLHALTSAVDAKDSYTCGHSERVALIARELAYAAGYDDSEAERVYIAGLLHDVGKIGVPEAVLRKCGKLTDAEFEAMKQHPVIGARILADVRQVQDIIPGVLHHHERFDGSGYPHGLAGHDIPVLGRIICLADALDAMTSNRTYRRGMPVRQAMDELRKNAGTQFDPDLTRILLDIGADRLVELLEQHRGRQGRDLQTLLRRARAA